MSEVVIVGAGLSGLVAAINCVRAGHEVRVLEKYKKVGGDPENHPSVDTTPMRPDRLGKFIGIELKTPGIIPIQLLSVHIPEKKYDVDVAGLFLHAVERGSRPTSLENYLYGIAKKEGVRFEFGWTLRPQSDLSQLPPNSIIATGLHIESFMALNLPHQSLYGYTSHKKQEGEPGALVCFSHDTQDYGYITNSNGIAFALFFDHKPVKKDILEKWGNQMREQENLEFANWRPFEATVATERINNPRLFESGKILAGTLAGMQDPYFFFGVHASLISGKIASIAVDDKAKAYEMFKEYTSFFKYSWLLRRFWDVQNPSVQTWILRSLFSAQEKVPRLLQEIILRLVPGFFTV